MSSLGALADPTRRRIVELLGAGDLASGEIVERFALSPPAISQHLKVDGHRRIYSLDPAGLYEIERWVARVRRVWSERLDVLARELAADVDSEGRSG